MIKTLITCQNASFAYEGKTIVNELNFEINNGDYLCIVGENGSGKSTLLKGLLGLKKPLSGSIHIDKFLKPNEIGYLPQQTQVQRDFPASAYEVVLSGRLGQRGLLPFYTKSDKRTAIEQMKQLDIIGVTNRCYKELSGGQQQRVLLARALCAAKKMIVLDEPTAGLDPVVAHDLYEQIKKANNNGMIIIMVSHDIQNAVKYAKKILHIRNSQVFFGDTAEYIGTFAGKELMGVEKNA